MSQYYSVYSSPLVAAIAALVGVGGCDDASEDSVNPSVALVVTQGALSLDSGTLTSANGIYGDGCTNRDGAWSVRITGGSDTLDNAELSVVKGNTGCVLTLTSIRAGLDGANTYSASPSFALTGAYQETSSSFAVGPPTPIAFYGNAYLDSLTFQDDFMLVILYSDDPNLQTGENTAGFSVQSATATASGVPAPNYTINMEPLIVSTDEADVVQTAAGQAVLTAVTVLGQDYVVLTTLAGTSYAEVDAAFIAGTPKTAIASTIDAAAFSLVGIDLTADNVRRYVIIANTISDVPSYQVFTITFHPPIRAP